MARFSLIPKDGRFFDDFILMAQEIRKAAGILSDMVAGDVPRWELASDLKALDIVGIYPNYAQAYDAWKDAAHRTVDDAHMRYFIVHLHRLLDPEHDSGGR